MATSTRQRAIEVNGRIWGLVVCAWIAAAVMPMLLIRHLDAKVLCFLVILLGLSCWFGLEARRRGERRSYHLKVTLPLVLAALSTAVGLVLRPVV